MITLGVIGTSWITHSFIAAAHSTGSYRLCAVSSRSVASAQDFASRYGSSATDQPVKLYTSLDELAADPGVTAVYIASPNTLHYTHAATILAAKKHVILEKPAVLSLAHWTHLTSLARENQVLVLEAFRHLYEPGFLALQQGASSVGVVLGGTLVYAQRSSRYDAVLRGDVPNIFSPQFGGGALTDLGVYGLASAVAVFGAPRSARYEAVRIKTGVDGAGVLTLRYGEDGGEDESERGFMVTIHCSKTHNSAAPSEIYGEKGTLRIPTLTDIERVTFANALTKEDEVLWEGGKAELNLRAEAVAFARAIEGDREEVERWNGVSEEVVRVLEGVREGDGVYVRGV